MHIEAGARCSCAENIRYNSKSASVLPLSAMGERMKDEMLSIRISLFRGGCHVSTGWWRERMKEKDVGQKRDTRFDVCLGVVSSGDNNGIPVGMKEKITISMDFSAVINHHKIQRSFELCKLALGIWFHIRMTSGHNWSPFWIYATIKSEHATQFLALWFFEPLVSLREHQPKIKPNIQRERMAHLHFLIHFNFDKRQAKIHCESIHNHIGRLCLSSRVNYQREYAGQWWGY